MIVMPASRASLPADDAQSRIARADDAVRDPRSLSPRRARPRARARVGLLRRPRGVGEARAESQIKRAYRKLALGYHPDKNPNDASAKKSLRISPPRTRC